MEQFEPVFHDKKGVRITQKTIILKTLNDIHFETDEVLFNK